MGPSEKLVFGPSVVFRGTTINVCVCYGTLSGVCVNYCSTIRQELLLGSPPGPV